MDVKGRFRILAADDHPLFREGLLAALRLHDDMLEVVGEACNGREAVRKAKELQPDIVIMDANMGEMNGIEAAREIVDACPHIHILMLTMSDDDETVFSAIRAGVRGYLLKGTDLQRILRAISVVGSGEAIFGETIARKMMYGFQSAAAKKPATEDVFPGLTEREQEVLEWICAGLQNEEIARRLNVSIKTVRNHVSNLLNKLQVEDRAQAIALAKDMGLGRFYP